MPTNELAVAMVPRVEKIARGFARRLPRHIDVEDLVQVGMIGMLAALKAYDAARGASSTVTQGRSSLEAYVERRIRGAIQDELRAMDPLSRDERKDARTLGAASRALEIELARAPEAGEIADRAKMPVARVYALAERLAAISMAPLSEDLVAGQHVDALTLLSQNETMARVAAAIDQLPERQRTVLALYYLEDLSLNQIAKMLGVTESRVCQISGDAVKRLRVALADA